MIKERMSPRINALSIDLEEWYHPELIIKHVSPEKINLIQEATETLLGLLNKHNTKATFFILGEVAVKNKNLIRKIHREGHEIASHGFSHKILPDIGPIGLRKELLEFNKVIAEILGYDIEVKGFRAPSFSLTQETNWAVDILKELKFKYDSSIFPIKINRFYGISKTPLNVYGLNANNIRMNDPESSLKEFPITLFEIFKFRIPVSGGFYLRLIPACLQKTLLRAINKTRPFIIFVHPWECFLNTPRIKLNPLSYFISYYNINYALFKLEYLIKNFNFVRIDKILGI